MKLKALAVDLLAMSLWTLSCGQGEILSPAENSGIMNQNESLEQAGFGDWKAEYFSWDQYNEDPEYDGVPDFNKLVSRSPADANHTFLLGVKNELVIDWGWGGPGLIGPDRFYGRYTLDNVWLDAGETYAILAGSDDGIYAGVKTSDEFFWQPLSECNFWGIRGYAEKGCSYRPQKSAFYTIQVNYFEYSGQAKMRFEWGVASKCGLCQLRQGECNSQGQCTNCGKLTLAECVGACAWYSDGDGWSLFGNGVCLTRGTDPVRVNECLQNKTDVVGCNGDTNSGYDKYGQPEKRTSCVVYNCDSEHAYCLPFGTKTKDVCGRD